MKKCVEIYNVHFSESASEPVNVDGPVRLAVENGLSTASSELFDAAQKQVKSMQQSVLYNH